MLKNKIIISIYSFLVGTFHFASVQSASPETEKFEKETSIHWNLKITSDLNTRTFEGKEIDRELAAGIHHSGLGVRCAFDLNRKIHDYDGKKVTYARSEESALLICDVAGYKIASKSVVCAKGRAKNKVGTVYSDAAELSFAKDGRSYGVRLSCSLK